MKRKRICIGLLTLAVSMFTVACSGDVEERFKGKDESELIEMYKSLETEYLSLDTQYNDLYTLYNGIQSETSPVPAIGICGDGTGRLTFNSVDSKIIFPTSFQYPDSTQAVSSSSVNIVSEVAIEPSTNWVLKLNGTTLELEHTSGISGIIKIGNQGYIYESSELQTQVLSQWFVGLPPSNITYTNISIGGNNFGSQAVTPTVIDSEDAYLRCGMVAEGDLSVTYVFVYRGSKDINKDESITNLLNSLSIYGSKIVVEQ